MLPPRWRVRASVSPVRLTSAALPLLTVRVLLGLLAWLFFNEYFAIAVVRAFPLVQVSFAVGLLLNLLVTLSYRQGRASEAVLAADIAANILSLALPIAASGGHSSPLLLLLPISAVSYALVLGRRAAILAMCAGAAMMGAIELADRAVLMSVVPLGALVHGEIEDVIAFVLVETGIGAVLATIWLTWVMRGAAGDSGRHPTEWAERDAGPAAVANALLTASELVSSLTRLDEILEAVADIAPRSIDMDYVGIVLWEDGTYVQAVASGSGVAVPAGRRLSPDEVRDLEWVRRLGHCVVVPAAEGDEGPDGGARVVLLAPLSSGLHFFGVLEIARRDSSRGFTQRDMAIADGIARQTAAAIERARLLEESTRLVRAVESTDDAVLITDAARRVVFVNEAFLRMLGCQREEVLGRDVGGVAGDLLDPLEQSPEILMRRSWRGETTVRRSDGASIPVSLNASFIRDTNGRVQGAVAILDDISEEKRFQEQMQRADRLAAVGEMAAGIAHEINNALAIIFGHVDVEGATTEELRESMAKIDAQAHRIAGIVRGVLGFARARPQRLVPVDLAELTGKVLELLRHDLSRQKVRVTTDFAASLPPARADPLQLQQVLVNLVTNAIHAMTGRSDNWLQIELRTEGDRLAVVVSDGGPGIPADVLPRIFDPFFSTKTEGSGLGLSVSYAIARAHGGDLRVESEPGHGATFTLLLPPDLPAAAAGGRVLLVDDEDEVAEAIAAMLVREGVEVTRVSTGREAFAMLESGDWDAVFLDVRLPDISGPEVFRRIEASRPQLARRVAFVTGGVWRGTNRLRDELPPRPILAKPCTQDAVREVLRLLRAARRQAA